MYAKAIVPPTEEVYLWLGVRNPYILFSPKPVWVLRPYTQSRATYKNISN